MVITLKDTTVEEDQHYYAHEKGSWATTTWRPIQEENQRSNKDFTTMQQNETNAVNISNNNEMDQHFSTTSPEEEPPD